MRLFGVKKERGRRRRLLIYKDLLSTADSFNPLVRCSSSRPPARNAEGPAHAGPSFFVREKPTFLLRCAPRSTNRPLPAPSRPAPALATVAELIAAELALRSLRIGAARAALARAHEAAGRARVPALLAEVADAQATLDRPAARQNSQTQIDRALVVARAAEGVQGVVNEMSIKQ